MAAAKRGPKPDVSRDDIEIVDRLSLGHPSVLEIHELLGVEADGNVVVADTPTPIQTFGVLRDIRREILECELDAIETLRCKRAAKEIDEAASREVAARLRGAVTARARPNASGNLTSRPRGWVVLDACDDLGLEPPSDPKLLSKMMNRAR
jgi:hypothetical protein